MFSHRSPALLGQTGFPAARPPLCRGQGALPQGQGAQSYGKAGGKLGHTNPTWKQEIILTAKPLVYRGQSKPLLMDVMQGAARTLRLFRTPVIPKNMDRAWGDPESPMKPVWGAPQHLGKLLRGTPAHPTTKGMGTSRPATSSPFGIRIQGNSLDPQSDTGAQVQQRQAAPTSSLPALASQKWHRSPTEAPSSPAARQIRGAAAAVLLRRKLRLLLQSISHPITALFFF